MHSHQTKWKGKNWRTTLALHGAEIETILNKLNTFDIWLNKLESNETAIALIPEMWMDGYASITFAGLGLYKYANMSLRSIIETGLRIVYFSKHPVEYEWWKADSRWYSAYQWSDVWGKRYEYFEKLELFKKFEEKGAPNKGLFKHDCGNCLSKIYDSLSGSIHTRVGRFQTSATAFSPNYVEGKFGQWSDNFTKTITYMSVIFALGFNKEFNAMRPTDKTKILDIGMGAEYKAVYEEVVRT